MTFLTLRNPNRREAAGGHYRPDIDGLRMIAVLSVVFYHFGVPPFSGGFVGVDIFFVISGFLITRLIHTEMREGRFTIWNFYERRVRRIFPALLLVMAVTTVAGAFLLFPHMYERFAISLLAACGFGSNIQFWSEAGYWNAASVTKPLLHTWSLGVEEQFYLIFPWLLYALRGSSRGRLLWVLWLTFAASLALNVVGIYRSPVATFYMLPTRFWELLLGGLLSVGAVPLVQGWLVRNLASLAGLALMLWSMVALSSHSLFPGANAIAPCLGAALVIYAGMGLPEPAAAALVNRVLATRVPVFIGLISYSLYLWHWPIYVLALQMGPDRLNAGQTVAAMALTFVLAVLSWRYVELPFRRAALSRRRIFALAGWAVAVLIAAGSAIWIGDGFPQRYGPQLRQILAEGEDAEPLRGRCFNFTAAKLAKRGLCRFGAKGVTPTILVWGDSHADAILPAVWKAAEEEGKAGYVAAHGHCAPLIGVDFVGSPPCKPFNTAVAKIALRKEITTVVLDAKWTVPVGEPSLDDGRYALLTDAQSRTASPAETRAVFERSLTRTVMLLRRAGKKVIIDASTPEFAAEVPVSLARMQILGKTWKIAPTRAEYLARQRRLLATFYDLAKQDGVSIVRLDSMLCPGSTCLMTMDGKPLFRDTSHLSAFGARQLAPLFRPVL